MRYWHQAMNEAYENGVRELVSDSTLKLKFMYIWLKVNININNSLIMLHLQQTWVSLRRGSWHLLTSKREQ